MSISYKQKLKDIRCFIFDVDGVLTNGMLHITNDGKLLRQMNIKDGYAMQLAVKKDIMSSSFPEVRMKALLSDCKNSVLKKCIWEWEISCSNCCRLHSNIICRKNRYCTWAMICRILKPCSTPVFPVVLKMQLHKLKVSAPTSLLLKEVKVV